MMRDDHKYDTLRSNDIPDDSSTDVEDYYPEDLQARKSKRSRSCSIFRSYRWIIDTSLLLVIVGLLLEKRWKQHKSHAYDTTGDLTGFAPQFSQHITTFKPEPLFTPDNPADFFLPTTKAAWLSIVPAGLGYVEIKDPSDYDNLPVPLKDYPNRTTFTTSMTHQLHCLYAIYEAYAALRTGTVSNGMMEDWHLTHCFDYLRQGIMCAGDIALEGAQTTFPVGMDGSDGWDAKHVCKDYGQILDYLNRARADDDVWI